MLLWCFQKLSNWELCTPQDLRKTCNITTWEHRESESLAQQGRSRAPWQELFQLVHLCFRGIQSIDSQLDFQTGHTTPTWSSYGWSPFTLLLAKPSATPDKSTNILPERCAYAWAMSNADWSATSLFTWQSTRCLENPCHSPNSSTPTEGNKKQSPIPDCQRIKQHSVWLWGYSYMRLGKLHPNVQAKHWKIDNDLSKATLFQPHLLILVISGSNTTGRIAGAILAKLNLIPGDSKTMPTLSNLKWWLSQVF